MIGRASSKRSRSGGFAQRGGEENAGESALEKWGFRGVVCLVLLLMTATLTREPKRDALISEDIDTSKVADQEIRAAFYFETVDLQTTKEARDAAVAKIPDYYRVDRDRVQGALKSLRERIEAVNTHRDAVRVAVLDALRASNSIQPAEETAARAVAAYVASLRDAAQTEGQDTSEQELLPDPAIMTLWLTPDTKSLPQRQYAPAAAEQTPSHAEGAEAVVPAETPRAVTGLLPDDPGRLVFGYGDRLSDLALQSLEFVLNQGVREETIDLATASRRIVILRDAPLADQQISTEIELASVPDAAGAAEALSARLMETARRAARDTSEPTEWAKLHDAAVIMAKPFIVDTIRQDTVYTAGARERAREAVASVMKQVEAGEIIQDRGKRWTAQSRSDVKTYISVLQGDQRPAQRMVSIAISNAIIAGLVLLCLLRSLGLLQQGNVPENWRTQVNLAFLLMTAMLVIGRISSYFEPSGFVLPVAAVGILYAILVDVRLAAMLSFLTATLVSVQYGYDWRLMVIGSAMSMAGVFSIFQVRRRSDMAAASLKAMLVGIVAVMAISLATDSLFSEAALRRLAIIGMNGFLCLLIVPGLLSPLERLFGITTDIQLLEYSDLNNEVLSRLAIKAPATYAHSLMIGQLTEAAAEAINANGLLARVCAYYHDIGKMERSEYFTENQRGHNVHDQMSPRMSARAIAAHVVEGVKIAKKYHLPKPIVDAILEHHGTCKIGFFYQQAVEQRRHGDVREEDFRYPGPKPQRPETAILMICDAAESGVRSIKNPNAERVREFVDKIIAARSADRQFDDCNLTLKQLDTIAQVVSERIMSNLHTRLAYPEPKQVAPQQTDNVIAMSGASE